MAWRGSAKRVATVSMREARWGGTAPVAPERAPRAARVNSRTTLSTWDLLANSSVVGTSPSEMW